jgi:uncharacterized protein with FMN-binding domain
MRRVILATVGTISGLILLLSFKTHPRKPLITPPVAAGSPNTTPTTGSAPTAPANGSVTRTITGNAADTRYGPVQVKITVTNGQLSSVQAIEYPTDRARDIEINSVAIPELNQEAASAKSANIDMISGATYTSDGYIRSLQSALDQAGLR